MKKKWMKCLVSALSLAMVVTAVPVNPMTVQAKETTKTIMEEPTVSGGEMMEEVVLPVYQTVSGTFGDNDGFSWSLDFDTQIMTVTGQVGTLIHRV